MTAEGSPFFDRVGPVTVPRTFLSHSHQDQSSLWGPVGILCLWPAVKQILAFTALGFLWAPCWHPQGITWFEILLLSIANFPVKLRSSFEGKIIFSRGQEHKSTTLMPFDLRSALLLVGNPCRRRLILNIYDKGLPTPNILKYLYYAHSQPICFTGLHMIEPHLFLKRLFDSCLCLKFAPMKTCTPEDDPMVSAHLQGKLSASPLSY